MKKINFLFATWLLANFATPLISAAETRPVIPLWPATAPGEKGDIGEEREQLGRIITELNRSWTDTLDIEIELVQWETHAYPSFSTDPQAAINEQLGDNYEIFIGLLWSRIGTSTPRARSGTLEEFKRAYSRFKDNQASIDLLIYFKDQPIPPSEVDAEQIGQIQTFKKSLGALGGLYWTFNTCADFEALVRPHLTKVIQRWKERIGRDLQSGLAQEVSNVERSVGVIETTEFTQSSGATDLDELGYLDYMEIGEQANLVMRATLARMTTAMQEIATKIRERSGETESLAKSKSTDLKAAKVIANQTASDLETFAQKTSAEVPTFVDANAEILRAFSGAASINYRDGHGGVETALKEVQLLRAALESSQEQLLMFAASLRSMPRMTTHLNRARQKSLGALAAVHDGFAKARSNSIMVEASIGDLLARRPSVTTFSA